MTKGQCVAIVVEDNVFMPSKRYFKKVYYNHCCPLHFSSKLGFEPPKLQCQSELGMKSGKILDSAITATTVYSQYYGPERARLDTVKSGSFYGAWIPKTQDMGQWIQVDLGKITKITRIATQGRQDSAQWVKSYSISFSLEGGPFLPYKNNQVNKDKYHKKLFHDENLVCIYVARGTSSLKAVFNLYLCLCNT